MSETMDEIDLLHKKVDLLAEYLGVEFVCQWGDITGMQRRRS